MSFLRSNITNISNTTMIALYLYKVVAWWNSIFSVCSIYAFTYSNVDQDPTMVAWCSDYVFETYPVFLRNVDQDSPGHWLETQIFLKTHLFQKFSKKITKFWLKSGQFWLIWQNSVQNFRKPSSKNAKTQFSRNVKSVNSVRRAQKKKPYVTWIFTNGKDTECGLCEGKHHEKGDQM